MFSYIFNIRPNIYCRDAHFCRQQEQMCGQKQSSYTPDFTAARKASEGYHTGTDSTDCKRDAAVDSCLAPQPVRAAFGAKRGVEKSALMKIEWSKAR